MQRPFPGVSGVPCTCTQYFQKENCWNVIQFTILRIRYTIYNITYVLEENYTILEPILNRSNNF